MTKLLISCDEKKIEFFFLYLRFVLRNHTISFFLGSVPRTVFERLHNFRLNSKL